MDSIYFNMEEYLDLSMKKNRKKFISKCSWIDRILFIVRGWLHG